MQYTIGFDLGGTKLAAALVRQDGVIADFIKMPVHMKRASSPQRAQRQVIQMMSDIAVDFKARHPHECSPKKFKGIGLASAGPMDVAKGLLIHPANYPGWKIVPIRQRVQDALQKNGFKSHVYFQNDAMAAALAEGWVGDARKMTSFAVVTIGTGIGTGLILNGQPCQTKGAGSEFGHTLIETQCVQKSPKKLSHYTVEGIASGTALLRRAKELGFKGSSVEELVETKSRKYTHLYEDMAWALASLCYNLSIGFHLDGIFLSGGLIKIQDLYFKQLQAHYRLLIRQFNSLYECPIRIAKTKNNAGVLGAAYLPFLQK